MPPVIAFAFQELGLAAESTTLSVGLAFRIDRFPMPTVLPSNRLGVVGTVACLKPPPPGALRKPVAGGSFPTVDGGNADAALGGLGAAEGGAARTVGAFDSPLGGCKPRGGGDTFGLDGRPLNPGTRPGLSFPMALPMPATGCTFLEKLFMPRNS